MSTMDMSPPHLDKVRVSFQRTVPLKNGEPKKRSRSFWDYKSQHNRDKLIKTLGIRPNTLISTLNRENNPFLMGGTRKDRFKYDTSPERNNVSDRLDGLWTVKRGYSQRDRRNPPDSSIRVKALPNIYQACNKNKVVQDILRESDFLVTRPDMLKTISNMKKQKLLENNYTLNHNNQGLNQRIKYTYADYHSRETNNGYGRTESGSFYAR